MRFLFLPDLSRRKAEAQFFKMAHSFDEGILSGENILRCGIEIQTYINLLEKLAIGVKDKDLVLAALGQQDVVFHHEGDGAAIFSLSVVKVLQNWPVGEKTGELTECQGTHLSDAVIGVVSIVTLQGVPGGWHV